MFKRVTIVALCCGRLPGAGGPRHGLQRLSRRLHHRSALAQTATAASPVSRPCTTIGPRPSMPRPTPSRSGAQAAVRLGLPGLSHVELRPEPRSSRCRPRRPPLRCRLVGGRDTASPTAASDHRQRRFVGERRRLLVVPLRRQRRRRSRDRRVSTRTTPPTGPPSANLANAEICGQCHSRYSYTAQTFSVKPDPVPTPTPLPTLDPNPTRRAARSRRCVELPDARATVLGSGLEPQLGHRTSTCSSRAGLQRRPATRPPASVVSRPTGRTPSGTGHRCGSRRGHDGSAAQYPEWASEGHADCAHRSHQSVLLGLPGRADQAGVPRVPLRRLPHPQGGRQEPDQRRCQVRHHLRRLPHAARRTAPQRAPGTRSGRLSSRDRLTATDPLRRVPQRRDPRGHDRLAGCRDPSSDEGDDGRVRRHRRCSSFPSVHKGKCVQCHMPPTSSAAARRSRAATTRSRSSAEAARPRRAERDRRRHTAGAWSPPTRTYHAVLGMHAPATAGLSRRAGRSLAATTPSPSVSPGPRRRSPTTLGRAGLWPETVKRRLDRARSPDPRSAPACRLRGRAPAQGLVAS